MKTLKTLTASLLVLISVCAFAADDATAKKLKIDYTLDTYVEAMANGKLDGLKDILTEDMKYEVTRGDKVINYTKAQLLSSLKESENVIQNCSTDYSLERINSSQAIMKVSMKYESFTKINYINLDKTEAGWQITKISNSYSK